MTTGQRMKLRRKELGLSAETVAEMLDLSPATVYRYENGDIEKIPGKNLASIANVLQTTPAYLMGWENSSVEPNKNDQLVLAISKARSDPEFFSLINDLMNLPSDQYASLKTIISALKNK